ncbi:ABC transporter permease [Nocardia sp. NPDC058658]|uniref:ABC transporter permease n=1 Tax=Nocardia sp. NPDC058658 TaxID=3346580 RepID=UPI003660A1D4
MSGTRAGINRGLIELRQAYTNPIDLIGQFLTPAITLGVLFLLRDKTYGDSDLSIAELAVPGMLSTIISFNGMYALLNVLVQDREDGTLLRAKAVPKGMVGYFVGKILTTAGAVLMQLAIVLGVSMVIIGGFSLSGAGAVATFAWVVVLGLLAVLPLGAILGSVLDTRTGFLLTIPLMAIIAISGIFYPITAMPGWLQGLAQVFPIYWLGLGMRSALLPAEAVTIELDQSWRHLETVGVLGLWAVVGLAIAPFILRRMASNESGSVMAQRRDKAMQRAF